MLASLSLHICLEQVLTKAKEWVIVGYCALIRGFFVGLCVSEIRFIQSRIVGVETEDDIGVMRL